MSQRNLGQVSAIWIDSIAPDNQKFIWYDTVSQKHKVYESLTKTWVDLNPQVVTNTDIATLKSQESGLSVGDFFYLTDIGTLAIAITTTKIWYVDEHGNYVVNDLRAAIQTYINSDNLLIDGTRGDYSDGQLIFPFSEIDSAVDIENANDYIVIRRKNGTVWSWVKAKLSGFVSAVSGNSISWNKGFYFNFRDAIDAVKSVAGGLVGYDDYQNDLTQISADIRNISFEKENAILEKAKQYTDQAVDSDEIYAKEHQTPWNLLNNPPYKPNQNANLDDILQILVSWVNVLRYANKIVLGNDFSANGRSGDVNYSDTVRTAIEKLVYKIALQSKANGVTLPDDFSVSDFAKELPTAEDSVADAIGKISSILFDLNNQIWNAKFRDDDWYATVNVGDVIGEFDSDGKPLYTASLEGAVYLLGAWYRETMNKRKVQSIYNAYYTSGRGDGRAESSTSLLIKTTEVGINILMATTLTFSTYQSDGEEITSPLTDDDAVLILRDLPEDVIRRIKSEYDYNNLVCTNIPVVAQWGDADYPFQALGTMYAILIQPPQGETALGYLKFIPFFGYVTQQSWEPSIAWENDGSGITSNGTNKTFVSKTAVNVEGKFGTGWMARAGFGEEMISITIPKFNFTLPCK